MSARFFSNRDVGQDAPLETLEHQQALLLGALHRAGNAPVSYAELRAAGVEFPASVVSELELAGMQIERCYEDADGSRRVVGVRLVSAPHVGSVADAVAGDMGAGRRLAPAALMVAAGVAVALVVVGLAGGSGRAGRTAAHLRPRASALVAGAPTRGATSSRIARPSQPQSQPQRRPQAQSSPTPVSAALAAELEAHGHELLQTGRYGEAVPVLRRALAATGESLDGCLQPASEQCLTYAYALYDLGRALMLTGSPAAAVGVLEHRLRIENQQPIVAAELASARRQLG